MDAALVRAPELHRERERTKRVEYHAENRARALEIYGGRCVIPGCDSDRLRLTYVHGLPEPLAPLASASGAGSAAEGTSAARYPVQRTLMIRIAKSGHRLPDPALEVLCVKHHLQKINRQRRNA